MTSLGDVYIGGMPSSLAELLDVMSNLIGCLSHVTWNGIGVGIGDATFGVTEFYKFVLHLIEIFKVGYI
jgi:hypothetical protein